MNHVVIAYASSDPLDDRVEVIGPFTEFHANRFARRVNEDPFVYAPRFFCATSHRIMGPEEVVA